MLVNKRQGIDGIDTANEEKLLCLTIRKMTLEVEGIKKVRIGIIGCRVIGKTHIAASAQSPIIELATVADLCESVARVIMSTVLKQLRMQML